MELLYPPLPLLSMAIHLHLDVLQAMLLEGMDLDMGTKALHMDLADLEPLPSPTGSVYHALATRWWFNRINRPTGL